MNGEGRVRGVGLVVMSVGLLRRPGSGEVSMIDWRRRMRGSVVCIYTLRAGDQR